MSVPSALRTPLVILIAGTLASALSIGLRNTFGLYLSPMSDAYGWGREIFALAIAVQNITWGLSAPLTGGLADRFGTGRMVALGALVYGVGLFMMAAADTPASLLFSAGLLIGFGTSATGFGVVLGAVGRVTSERNRTLYLGIATAGGSLGQFTLVPLSQLFISAFGWSQALLAMGVLAMLMFPLSMVLTGRADSTPSETEMSGPVEALVMAGRQPRFWLLFWGFFVCGFHVTFIATHLPSFLTDNNIDPVIAAWALSVIGLFNIIGSLSFGQLGGRFSKRKLLAILYSLRCVFITMLLIFPLTPWSVLLFASGMGFTWLATVPLTSALVSQMYGLRYMNTLFSGVFLGHQIGAFLGVWGGGRIFDLTGSYTLIWYAAIALGLISALLHMPIDERSNEAYRGRATPPPQPLAEEIP